MCRWIILSVLLFAPTLRSTEVIHLFVALADNDHQGIVKVPAKIGNGDDASANLYWGCDEGVRTWFTKSPRWKKIASLKPEQPKILERLVFKHTTKDVWLVADAWRGREIKTCLQTFVKASCGEEPETLKMPTTELQIGGGASLIAYIGHNGFMDFPDAWPASKNITGKPAIILCCKSDEWFSSKLRQQGASPLLTTTQFMYPGAFILHDALEVWLGGGKKPAMREAAGRAYAKNQGISAKAATGVFASD